MKRLRRLRRSIAGFTLIELLVILIIIGVLFAIAAPGWNALLSRQRVSTAREQVLQVIRQAQSDARTSRTTRAVVFDPNSGGIPRVANIPFPYTSGAAGKVLPVPTANVSNWVTLGNGDIKSNALIMTTNQTSRAIVFDSTGAVAQPPYVDAPQTLPVTVTLAANATATGTRRCVVVDTLLGGVRLEEGAYNASTLKGCP